jgi:hypothetical protein
MPLAEDALPPMTPATRIAAARAAGDFLLRNLDHQGRFRYVRTPFAQEDEEADGDAGYNLLRHAGTLHALCQLYATTGEVAYRSAADRAATWLLQYVQVLRIGDRDQTVLVISPDEQVGGLSRGQEIKTGGVALAVVALLSLSQAHGDDRHLATANALGDYLVSIVWPDGSIYSKYLLDEARFDRWQSSYYPGETLYALALLERRATQPARSQAMVRLLLRLADGWARENDRPTPPVRDFDHWSLIALHEVYPLVTDETLAAIAPRPTPWTRERLLLAARAYAAEELSRQLRRGPAALRGDMTGGIGSSSGCATRLEGIQAVHRLLAAYTPEPPDWSAPIERTLQLLLACQYPPALPDQPAARQEVTGGVRRAWSPNVARAAEVRIDYCQHAISAWLNR